jgi:acetate CoA-transferase
MAKGIRNGIKAKIMTVEDAVSLIKDEDVIVFSGAGGGLSEPTKVILALADRYKKEQNPKNLTYWHATGLGDRANRGMSPLAQQGMVKRIFGGHWGQSPRLAEMAERNEIEAYNFPQGVMAQLLRTAAAHQPGLLSRTGIDTFVDPRQQGGRLNEVTTEELVKLVELDNKEYLFYPTIYPDIAFIRGTTADAEGYISMEDEIAYLDTLAAAQAVHNNGGIVICQVQRVVKKRTLHPKRISIPGYLIDVLVVDPEQSQLYVGSQVNRVFSGDYTLDLENITPLPLSQRKVVARRCLMEVKPGFVGNVGVGIADGIGTVAQEEGVSEEFTLTVETGPIGGATAQGIFFGATINLQALLDMPAQFDFYHGGGLDVCFLSFAEIDKKGNVNVHKFNGKIMGTGGFIDICQNTRKVVFCGTLRAGSLKESIVDKKLVIEQEGKFEKLIDTIPEVTFNGAEALKNGQEVIYITERAVFRLTSNGLELIEIAPGMDLKKDIFDQIGFSVNISKHLKEMDLRLFSEGKMNIKEEFLNR